MSHVPLYVYVLFLVLLWMGVARCYPRIIRVERLLIMPALMLVLGARGYLELFSSVGLFDLLAGIVGSVIGLGVGIYHVRTWTIAADRAKHTISLPGDAMMLVVILATFFFEFALHYAIESGAVSARNPMLSIVAAALWTLFIGMSAGRNLNLAIRYLRLERARPKKDLQQH